MRRAMRRAALACAAVLSLAASAQADEQVAYACDSGRKIGAVYPAGEDAGARLTIGERTFDLYRVRSGSGARFATEQGLKPDHGLQWWVKGEEATLSEMVMDHTAPGPTVIDTCRIAPSTR